MKLTAEELLIVGNALSRFGPRQLPLRAASWIVLLNKKLKSTLDTLSERRNEITKMFIPEGQNAVPPEKMEAWKAALQPLFDEEIEVGSIPKIKRDIFEQVLIAPQDLLALDFFLED